MSLVADMACREFVERVTDYFEGALAPQDRMRFEEHIAACPHCERYLEQMRTTLRLTGKLAEADIPPEGRGELLEMFRRWRDTRP